MDKKHTSLKFKAKVKPIEKINDEFTLVKIYVQGIGKNRNFSYMSKENIERALPTLSYVPIVGHLIQELDENGNPTGKSYMGGHDYIFTDDWELKSLCVPYGVVKEKTFDFEMVNEYEDKKKTEYLTAEAILWTGRYPELMEAINSEDVYFNQSMEINVNEYRPYEKDSNYTEFVDFQYSALCLLGKADDKNSPEHTEPCFIESKVIPIQYNLEQEGFSQLMSELKSELAFYFNKSNTDGKEASILNKFEDLLKKYNKAKEDITFDYSNMSDDELEAEFAKLFDGESDDAVDNVDEENDDSNGDSEENSETTIPDSENPDNSNSTENGSEESPVSNDDKLKKKKVEIETLRSEYEEYKANHLHTNEEFNELQRFKSDTEFAQLHSKREEILANANYTVLAEKETDSEGNEVYKNKAFGELVSEMDNYSLEELDAKAKVILAEFVMNGGKFSTSEKQEEKKTTVTKKQFSIPTTKTKPSRYGNLFKK